MVCKFEDTSVSIKVEESGMYAWVICHHHTVKLRLGKAQRQAYAEWLRGDPSAPITDRHGSPPDWWYKGLIEKAKQERMI